MTGFADNVNVKSKKQIKDKSSFFVPRILVDGGAITEKLKSFFNALISSHKKKFFSVKLMIALFKGNATLQDMPMAIK